MTKREHVKRQHERAVADQLLSAVGVTARFVRMGSDRGEPDVIYERDGRTLGIEVATVHHEDSDARQEWTLATGEREFSSCGVEMREGGPLLAPDAIVSRRVQGELSDKFRKRYGGIDDAWLCVQIRDPLATKRSVRKCTDLSAALVRHLSRLNGTPFARVYLQWLATSGSGGRDGIVVAEAHPDIRIWD